jgi:hypothetical protein
MNPQQQTKHFLNSTNIYPTVKKLHHFTLDQIYSKTDLQSNVKNKLNLSLSSSVLTSTSHVATIKYTIWKLMVPVSLTE